MNSTVSRAGKDGRRRRPAHHPRKAQATLAQVLEDEPACADDLYIAELDVDTGTN